MRSRMAILKDLVLLQGNIEGLECELLGYPWDSEMSVIKMGRYEIKSVIQRCINDEITFEVLTDWANAIECRDDIEFEEEVMQEIIFELANPEINGALTKERLQKMGNEL